MSRNARRSRETWEQLVNEFERSGLTNEDFAARHVLNPRSLENWVYRIRREHRLRPHVPAAVQFVPLAIRGRQELPTRPAVSAATTGDFVEALVGSLCVRFRAGVDSRYMGQLLAALCREMAC